MTKIQLSILSIALLSCALLLTGFVLHEPKRIGCSVVKSVTDDGSVNQYQTVLFELSGGCSSSRVVSSWSVSDGEVVSTPTDRSALIYFDTEGSVTISATIDDSDPQPSSKNVTVSHVDYLTGGTITSGKYQSINYDSTNNTAVVSSPAHGDGTYTYTWLSSPTQFGTFTSTSKTSSSLLPINLTTTTYFIRKVQSLPPPHSQSAYSDTVVVKVYPQLVSGTASSSQSINYNTVPSSLSCTAATGGKPGDHTYTWQSSSSAGGPFISTGVTGLSYSPSALTTSTFYRVETNSNGVKVYSNAVFINVYPDLNAGSVTPSALTINYDTSPDTLKVTGVSGGTGSGYTYQWYSSENNSEWGLLTGATSSFYVPDSLITTTWFRIVVSNNGVSKTSASNKIDIYPELFVSELIGGNDTIPPNTYRNPLLSDGVSGGNGYYVFQWQKSFNGTKWRNVNVHTQGYPKEVLSSTTWYKLIVTSNGATKSVSTVVYVGATPKPCCAELQAGIITTTVRMLDDEMSADSIKATDASGGSIPYSYRWEKSKDGIYFYPTSITTKYYPPEEPNDSTFLRRSVTDHASHTAQTCAIQLIVESLPINKNIIRTRIITKEGIRDSTVANDLDDPFDVGETTQFYDGLGRPIQKIVTKGSPDQKDMISVQGYDQFNRESYHYLPYASSSSDGSFQLTPFSSLIEFNSVQFPSDHTFYGTTQYETSPLNRLVVTHAPGDAWLNHGASTSYLFNTAADSVLQWTVDDDGTISAPPLYAAGKLVKTTTTDESSHMVVEFKDLYNHVILKKVQAVANPISHNRGWACTYYVYDKNNNLVVVLPPEAANRFIK